MEKKGHFPVKNLTGGRLSYLCPLPWHAESKPSFVVWTNSEYENFYCFGCFPGDAEVCLPNFSSCKITDLKKGQEVAGGDGQSGRVSRKLVRDFAGKITRLKSKKVYCELVSTWDHEVYVLPYINKTKRRPRFSGRNYGHHIYKYGEIVKKKAHEVRIGDSLCIPIAQGLSHLSSLDIDEWTDKHLCVKGPYPQSFGHVELTNDLLYLFGMYIAEGSVSDRVIRFSFNVREIPIAERIKETLKRCFSLESRYFVPKNRENSLELTCCSATLSKVFKEWFGDSSNTKKLPEFLLCLSNQQSAHIVDGYFDGDGYQKTATRKVCETVSKQWARQLFDILNRFQSYPSLNRVNRERRKTVYSVSWTNSKNCPGKVGIYKNEYYCVPVVDKSTSEQTLQVFNLTVTSQHSYVVDLFAVGNCQAKHNIIHLVAFLDSVPARTAIEKLSDGLEFTIADDEKLVQADHIQHYLKIAGVSEGNHDAVGDLAKSMVEISNICNMFLESVDYNEKECDRMDRLWGIVDQSLQDFDFEKIEKIRADIGGLIMKHKKALQQKEAAELTDIYGGDKDDK